MTPEETSLLTTFLNQLQQAGTVTKDPQAATLIADAVARQPDAAYLLVQRSLLQDRALANASARIASLEAQTHPAATAGGGFLDSGNNAWGRAAVATAPNAVAPTQFNTPQAYAAAPAPSRFFGGGGLGGMGGGGSFLSTMAATAAGVAGGAFLFQGIENLMGHHGNSGHLMDSQAPFGGMADSVDQSGRDGPAARNDLLDTSANNDTADLPDADVAIDDGSTGSDDSLV